MDFFKLIVGYFVFAYVLWIFFLGVMSLKWAYDQNKLTTFVISMAIPMLVIAFLIDVSFNILSSIVFLELPKEWTFSQRMGRYKYGTGLRAKIAVWICANLLDPFQIGGHCR